MEEKTRWETLLPYEFEDRIRARPLAYVPVGSLEWHGEHLALGNDGLKMHALCVEAARIGGGIVYPPVYYCIPTLCGADPSRYGRDFTFYGRPEVLKPLLLSVLAELERIGFEAAVLVTGHTPPEQIALMKEVAADYGGRMTVRGTCDMDFGRETIGFTSDHAAKWETSLLWHLHPDLVDLTRLDPAPEAKPFNVYGDDPRTTASPALGRTAARVIAEEMAALGNSLLERPAP